MVIRKANPSQIKLVYNTLAECLPSFFQQRHCFELYTNDVIFEDNIRNIKTYGLRAYTCYATLFKIYANFKFRDVNLRLLKMTEHLDESCIKVRWRVVGDPHWSLFVAFWSFPPGFPIWKTFGTSKPSSSSKESNQIWIDGFSIFHVNFEGKVYKHTCDKLIPEDNQPEVPKRKLLLPLH